MNIMKAIRFLVLAQILGSLLMVIPVSAQKAIVNGTDWKDTQGQPISAHEPFVGLFIGMARVTKAIHWDNVAWKERLFKMALMSIAQRTSWIGSISASA